MRRILALSVMFVSGCSFIFVDTPPSREVATKLGHTDNCTRSRAPAIIDTVIAVSYGLSTANALSAAAAGGPDAAEATAYAVGAALGGALFTAAAYYGYSNARECEELRDFIALQPKEAK